MIMIMTINEAIVKHNFITKILLKSGDSSLSKDLKVKIMSMRIELSKIRKEFDEDVQEAVKQLKTDRFEELSQNQARTEAEETELNELVAQINSEYDAFIQAKGLEETSFSKTITEDEYYEIVEVNSDKDVEINGSVISAPDFLEVLYSLFVA